jgi:hypothetical protein
MIFLGNNLTLKNQTSCEQNASEHNSCISCILASWPRYQAHQLLHAARGSGRRSFGKHLIVQNPCHRGPIDIDQEVSATPFSALVVTKAGFEEWEIVCLDQQPVRERAGRDLPNAADVVLGIGIQLPSSRSPSSGNASRSKSPK